MAFAHKTDETDEIILPAPMPAPKLQKPDRPPIKVHKASPAPHYPNNAGYGGHQMAEAGKIKGYVSDTSHSRGMVEKEMNPREGDKFAPKLSENDIKPPDITPADAMNDASDTIVKEAMSGKVPEIEAPPPRPINRSNPELERKFQIWFSLTQGQRELRAVIYPLVPMILKACPTWDSQLSSWTSCQNAIPDQDKFAKKLKTESRETQIQQWFFLNEMADIGASEDDVLRAQTFLARYFSEMVEDQLQREGWCFGPSWVAASEQSWMNCMKMPLRSARTDAGWGQYQKPRNAPKPRWPIPG
ncbi:hypothetical protein RF55_10652 [Lasius niger]|uniref:Uncharacterized protein n=1 Tax=Lasius niger TaxID=67767 RepID=A0A0J7NAQ3_LASNI|nr:hypothetical protein RF55_10652 [Lasius niger]